jgi:Tol biopolymer transport system component
MLCLIVVFLLSSSSDTFAQGDLCKIVFQSDRDGNDEIYVMDASGMHKQRLTNNLSADGGPAWSPDGSHIAFWSGRDGNDEVFVMESDGSNVVQITTGMDTDEPPDWSPDGSQIAFYSNHDGQRDIYIMHADGSNMQRVTSGGQADSAVAWSPDGSQIAFQSTRDGNYEIYTMDVDGSNIQRITSHGAVDSDPSWSPDGSKLAFFSNRDGHWETYTIETDGTDFTAFLDDSYEDYRAVWKDTNTLIFQSNRWGGDDQITVSDGTDITQLTTMGGERADVWCTSSSSSSSPVATVFPTPITITTLPLTNTMPYIADKITSLWDLHAPEAFAMGGLLFAILIFSMMGILKRLVPGRYEEDE